MLQLYSDFCPKIFKSTKDFISQYNHIAFLIQFGLLHKMEWSSRTRSTEVQDHEEKATIQHQLWNGHPYSLTNYSIILNDTSCMSLKSFHCWHPIVVHRLQYTPTELCHVQSTTQCQETTKAPHMVDILVYYIKMKWNRTKVWRGGRPIYSWEKYATLQNKDLPPILINKQLYYPRWHMLCLVTWEPFLYWALTLDCISWIEFYVQLSGSGLLQMPGFPGQKLCTLRFCMGRRGFVYLRKHLR
jgi:hypothetical protein